MIAVGDRPSPFITSRAASYHVSLSATHGMRPSVSRARPSQPARISNSARRERVGARGIWHQLHRIGILSANRPLTDCNNCIVF